MTATAQSPAKEVLASAGFRRLMTATVLTSMANGTTRFGFVWAMQELTSWGPAIGLLGVMLGLPALLVSVVAGGWSDRFDRRHVAAVASAFLAIVCAVSAVLLGQDLFTPRSLAIAGFIVSIPVAAIIPPLQAMVPSVADRRLLVNAVALQNLAMLASMAAGSMGAGIIIDTFGTAVMLGVTAAMALAASVGLLRLSPEAGAITESATGARGLEALREGLAAAKGDVVVGTLILTALVFGIGSAAAGLLIPLLAEDVLGTGSTGAGMIMAAMSLGLIVTATFLATRVSVNRPARLFAIVFAAIAGPGLVAIGLAPNQLWALLAAFVWGAGGGIALTLQRAMIQHRTVPEVMGRIMGLLAMAQYGSFPVGALAVFLLIGSADVRGTMVALGLGMLAVASVLCIRLARADQREARVKAAADAAAE